MTSYVVQVFSSFASAELRPLLVRLEETATVKDCVQASLNKYLERQPLMVLPGERVEDYALCLAGGDGFPMIGSSAPLEPFSILRDVPGLAFPFMLCIVFSPLKEERERSQKHDTPESTSVGPSNKGSYAHQTLTTLEKQAMAKELKERERIRDENLRLIERRRMDKDREAYQHCESYEVMRRDQIQKQKELADKAELERELKEQEEELRREAAAVIAEQEEIANGRGGSSSAASKALLLQHRREMEAAVEEERSRIAELQRAREARMEQQRKDRELMLLERRKQQEREKESRMATTLDSLIDDLHNKLAIQSETLNNGLQQEQLDRKDIERMESDLRGIASLEDRRHVPKIAERDFRVRAAVKELTYQQSKLEQSSQLEQSRAEEETQKYTAWLAEEQRRKEALVAKLELEFRNRSM